MKKILIVTVLLITFGLFNSCVTTKKSKDEIGFVGKKYHDLTAKFNGYFNANELYEDSKLQLANQYQDNYNQLLNVFPYESVEDPEVVEENMDKAIEKLIKVSSIHEVSKWVDDCYVLMGKSQYLKGDYESAQETFEYFIDDFNPKDPDSRVYQTPDRKGAADARKKEQERERKIVKEEREKAKKEKEQERKNEQKKRKKEKNNRNKNKGKRTERVKNIVEETAVAVEELINEPKEIVGSANSSEEIPIDADEAYLNSLNQDSKKKQKLMDNPFDGGFMKHRPSYYLGMLWLSKSYIKRDKWLDAKYYLDRIEEEGFASEEILNEVHIVRADLLLKMKDYNNALVVLDKALEESGNRKQNARLAFIMAQIYQMKGDAENAYTLFERVSDFNPDFEMALNAKMNQLKNSWAAGKTDSKSTISKLNKLAKDSKNEPYKGSIFFTQAEILLADGNETEALDFFNKALEFSAGGNKTEIYYRLASLFLSRERYLDSKNYYDSTLTLMSTKDERYILAQRYSTNLKGIAKNISIITLQDSLLKLASMSKEDLEAFALEKVKQEAESKKQDEAESSADLNQSSSVLSGNSRFFAYNPTALQKGRQDFRKRWGVRPLEDNWRRSNKSSSLLEVEEEVATQVEEIDYSKEIQKILREIPSTDEAIDKSNKSVELALFELGTGFRTYIENYAKSNETLENLFQRYPDTEHRVEAFYYMYLNHTDLGNSDKAKFYYNKILMDFPESSFAIYLKDPTNENALMTEERKINLYYENTYQEFENGKYQLVFDRIEKARVDFGQEHKMAAKYDLLRAMAIGNLEGQSEYINALRGVILKYNNSPEQTYAREMLRFLRGDEEAFGDEVSEADLNQFKIEDDKLHYVILLLYGGDGNDINNAKKDINKYNEDNFSDWRLRSTSMYLNQEKKTHLILLRRFQDKAQAMEYYQKYSVKPEALLDPEKYSYDIFAINQLNYREVITQKSAGSYRVFFEDHYLGK